MKETFVLAVVIIAVFAVLRFLAGVDPFLTKVAGVVMAVIGAIIVFAFGGVMEGMSGPGLKVAGALFIAGVIIIIFV
jgi:hypothetical protein